LKRTEKSGTLPKMQKKESMTKEKEIVSNTNLKVKENDKTIVITPE